MSVPARPASTVCLLREGGTGTEVLMVRRSESARYMGGVWVFPGGVVDEEDDGDLAHSVVAASGDADVRWLAAGLRELVEEVGLWITTEGVRTTEPIHDVFAAAAAREVRLDGDALTCFARWITPAPLPLRFDTKFYVARVEAGHDPSYDPKELSAVSWVRPSQALGRAERGEWSVAFPTRKTLSLLAETPATTFIDGARDMPVEAVQPRVTIEGGELLVLLPEDEGFVAAGAAESDPAFIARLHDALRLGGVPRREPDHL